MKFKAVIPRYRHDIQSLRGISVLAVILFHSASDYFPNGYLGVDAFFVISGFVIAPLIQKIFSTPEREIVKYNLKDFFKQRFFRLIPALSYTVTISTFLILLIGNFSDLQRFARQGIATYLLLGNVGAYRYSGDYFSPNPNPLVHTWSLAVEFQIYILVPLFYFMFHSRQRFLTRFKTGLLFLTAIISFIAFIYSFDFGLNSFSNFWFYSTTHRFWQFSLGAIIYGIQADLRSSKPFLVHSMRVFAALVFMLICFSDLEIHPTVASLVATGATALLILTNTFDFIPNLPRRSLEWLGNRSYSVYLVHMPVIYLTSYSPLVEVIRKDRLYFMTLFQLMLSIGLGSILYEKCENRFRRKTDSPLSFGKSKSVVIFLFLPLLLLLSLNLVSNSRTLVDGDWPQPSSPLPWKWDSKCQLMGEIYRPNKICFYGDRSLGKELILIGDSHAASNSRAVIEVGKSSGYRVGVFTMASCSFILDRKNYRSNSQMPGLTDQCIAHNFEILNYLKERKPAVTVVSMRSSSEYILPNTQKSRLTYRMLVNESLLELNNLGTNVLLIGAEPEYVPVDTLLDRLLGRTGYFSRIPFEDRSFWKQTSVDKIHYLDTIEVFCPMDLCRNRKSGVWLFNDEHHLSKDGAEMLIPSLKRSLEDSTRRVQGGF